MALSQKAREILTVALANAAVAKEIADALDAASAASAAAATQADLDALDARVEALENP